MIYFLKKLYNTFLLKLPKRNFLSKSQNYFFYHNRIIHFLVELSNHIFHRNRKIIVFNKSAKCIFPSKLSKPHKHVLKQNRQITFIRKNPKTHFFDTIINPIFTKMHLLSNCKSTLFR